MGRNRRMIKEYKYRTRKELFLKVLNKYTTLQKEICNKFSFLRDRNLGRMIDQEAEELWENWKHIELREIPNEQTCVWFMVTEEKFYTDCRHAIKYESDYVYCPFCGRKISG